MDYTSFETEAGESKYIIRGEPGENAKFVLCAALSCMSLTAIDSSAIRQGNEVVLNSRRYSNHPETQGCQFKPYRHRVTKEAKL